MAPALLTSVAHVLARDYDGTQGDIGNEGTSQGSIGLSTGAMVAIIVVVVIVAIIGGKFPSYKFQHWSDSSASTAALFFIAKKKEWTAGQVVRHSVRRVVTAMTPRRTEFPQSVKRSAAPARSHQRSRDVEKASSKERTVDKGRR